ncbi:BglG family transcription antiterminator LicT [Thermohalobacter berrensis]|uniref:BglG family transcription antiterminator LicT n=1 Tax=Thermohalobacter berrensis TaxID=99594 RepID=UPI001602632D|nr:PRD domain-containing protein [Thermohalobacter berrensis]
MRIKKVLNNNAVVVEEAGEEKIIMGLGIGFNKKKRQKVEEKKIEKVFIMDDKKEYNQFKEMLKTVPEEHISVAQEIIEYAQKKLDTKLNEHIHIALTDHLSFAIERLERNIEITNKLLNEIKVLYKKEYEIGLWAKDLIKKRLNVEIPDDEVGYIALHIHTATLDSGTINETMNITSMIQDMVEIVNDCLNVNIDEESLSYQRLVTHLKFALQRLTDGEAFHDMDDDVLNVIKEKYVESFKCAQEISKYLKEETGKEFPENELGYITLHIQKINRDKTS